MTIRKNKRRKPLAAIIRFSAALLSGLLVMAGCFTANSIDQNHASAKLPDGRIKHIVFLIKENRTFDNYFGTYPRANGATTAPTITGEIVPLKRQADVILDPDHTSEAHDLAYNNGLMNGFQLIGVLGNQGADLRTNPYANNSLTQFYQEDIPAYWAYAENFVLADNMFSSVSGPSLPNHLFMVAAQSGNTRDNPLRTQVGSRGMDWGCESNDDDEVVEVWGDTGEPVLNPVCFDFRTLADELNDGGYSWRYYAPMKGGGAGQKGYFWSVFASIKHIRFSDLWANVTPVDQFKIDVATGNLPVVSWVVPFARHSEHPNYSVCEGENWTVDVMNALMQGPAWESTAVIITWDDFGGLYDHVPPRQIDRVGLGFRVPLLIISPYTKQGFVDSTEYEFSSLLRYAEDLLGLAPLTNRDRNTSNMFNAFDFEQDPLPPLLLEQRHCPAASLVEGGWDFQD